MAQVEKVKQLPKLKRKMRVAAYTRVSTDKNSMLHSLSNQVSYYSSMIQSHAGWAFAGVYADQGLTGTKDNRDEFVRLINDAKAGKIDMIITKSMSRFARNTLTMLQVTRDLKAIGVDIFFQSENLHSMSEEGEFLLTVIASIAQEESRQVSENQKWRIKKDFEQGLIWGGTGCYGYCLVDKKLTVIPEQAEIVKRIFQMYLEGMGITLIAKVLNNEGIPAAHGGLWKHMSVIQILGNINYTGNLLLQKTYTENHLTKRVLKNKGELPMYYVEDDHEPIITLETFNAVTAERHRRHDYYVGNGNGKHKNYPFTGMLVCEKCGKTYRHKVTCGRAMWICSTYNTLGKNYCASKQIPEAPLYTAINDAMGYAEFDETDFKRKVVKIIVRDGNLLTLQFKDGGEQEVRWVDHSRRDSWTPEMREQARQFALKRYGKGGTE